MSKRNQIQAPKGVSEYVPPQSRKFESVREALLAPARNAGYELIELPVFEDTELFTRGVGESTDVVSKEMYTFEDRGGRSITLRPEGTAGVMRAVIEHGLDRGQLPAKLYYSGAFFRAERPQAGRYRQFYQVGIEAIGIQDSALDAEVIAIANAGFKAIGLKRYRLEITSLGDAQSRAKHRIDLVSYIEKLELDEVTRSRAEINPLRLFDDKREEVKKQMNKAPLLLDYLSEDSRKDFESVQKHLKALNVEFVINPRMVRGLDYYTGTTFEFVHELLGAQSGIGGGGRYDGLMSELGGQELSGIGFGLGIDRCVLAADAEGISFDQEFTSDLFIIPLGDESKIAALTIAQELRNSGLRVEISFGDRALKGSMKAADKSGAAYVIVLGESEIASGAVELKEMSTGKTTSVTLTSLQKHLQSVSSK
ncbi:MAG: histidine--tRNA ligase [Actinobacteria bacterium]|jgi:histidyl-tRNA synthetase|nr:histidine--tRNA ligase [Actinomycetota bacterium]NDA94592.1 histidine--tRNA ligase [Actinomycetota bacterium]NDH80427.1 histidine--tRNA ligase [Actinomycetota bacterium]NDH98792.1 histidine--tRNA ligase [Actinomycetota bacterium]NDI07753.1 histidine--tRNA ligase [Actinomycetota bacterium]